jgi:SEC-C motif-containing protein
MRYAPITKNESDQRTYEGTGSTPDRHAMNSNDTPCPCGGKQIHTCCGPFLAGTAVADTVEKLMRSRFSAYVTGAEDYLKATWHPSTRPQDTITDPSMKWLGLEVKSVTQDADQGTVSFVARCRVAGKGHRLQETSRFVREEGLWFYVDGEFEKPPVEKP